MALGDNFKTGIAELAEDDSSQTPRSKKHRPQSGFSFFTTSGYDYYDPPEDEMHKYWRAFEEMPYVRRAITSFAREVVEPGWWIEAENQEQAEKLAKWFRQAAVIDGIKNQDFALLAKQALIQREVRGTCLVEHVPDSNGGTDLAGLKLINPETVSIFTKDGSSVLLESEDSIPEDVPRKNGETPAFVQFWETQFGQDPIPFTKDEITKLTRDADIGDPYGTSVLKTVLPRIISYREKLNDLDVAIKQKAWQVWIFQFGPDEDPWHPDDIDDFMDDETGDEFTPGTKHGVQGDIDVETIGGEVPDIQDEIGQDINHIMSALPMPKWAIGQPEDVNQYVSEQQENLLRNQIREARRDLEYRFQEVLDKKAEELGYDPDTIKLHISDPTGEEPNPYEERGSVIHYKSDAEIKQQQQAKQGAEEGGSAGNQNAGEEGSQSDESSATSNQQ